MKDIVYIHIPETDSTNRLLREYTGDEGRLMTVATTDYQTTGRGQGTNTWESERGSNLLVSIRLHPRGLHASRQYAMAEAGALAVRDTVARLTGEATIKWPNDIYVGDRKISGTLSECDISGSTIKTCTLGIGINVNQRSFAGGAPNPVSIIQLTGRTTPTADVLDCLTDRIAHYAAMVDSGQYERLHNLYLGTLYRREGLYRYRDAGGEFMATTATVRPEGPLVLRRADGRLSEYEFKEVKFII